MKRTLRIILGLLASLFAAGACDRSNPTAPTRSQEPTPVASPPTPTGLLLSPVPSLVVVGTRLPLTATRRYSDGSLQPVQPEWSVTPAAAAEISPSGLLVARGLGDITVTGRFEGLEARAFSTVIANYHGTWRGTWTRLECFGRRCHLGEFANRNVDLLITHNERQLAAVMMFGPWDATRYALTGRGLALRGDFASLGLFWIERGPNGERLFEISATSSEITVSNGAILNGRLSLRFTEGAETTRLEVTLDNLALVSRTVRIPG
jgi:hypothetical protein